MTTRADEWGVWKVEKGENCNIEALIEPSNTFRQMQEVMPEPPPERNILAELDELKAKVIEIEEGKI